MSIREAGKAGTWYRGDAKGLEREVADCMARGETLLSKLPDRGMGGGAPTAAVVPHAGLFFSGGVAATAFTVLREKLPRVDSFIVFGACHRMHLSEPALWARGGWQTPLGMIRVDEELAEALIESGMGSENEAAHEDDNSIELTTPFIKVLFPEAAIVPVAMAFFPDSWRMGEAAAGTVMDSKDFAGKTVVALASTDLTHYGETFGIMPAGTGAPALKWAGANDKRFLDSLVDMRMEDVVPIAKRDHSACGAGAAAAAAGWAKKYGARKGRLLAYTTSYDVERRGEAEHFVGYASIVYDVNG